MYITCQLALFINKVENNKLFNLFKKCAQNKYQDYITVVNKKFRASLGLKMCNSRVLK